MRAAASKKSFFFNNVLATAAPRGGPMLSQYVSSPMLSL
jgi:hypothetical protein